MKRIILIAIVMFMVTSAFAQEFIAVKMVIWKNENVDEATSRGIGKYDGSIVELSDGTTLIHCARTAKNFKDFWYYYTEDNSTKIVNIDIQMGADVEGRLYKRVYMGEWNNEVVTFFPIAPEKIGVYTIKKASVHEVNSEFSANMNADLSYKCFFVILTGGGKATSQATGSAKGGLRTIVNIFFDNSKNITIEASTDPIWLDAEPGMQVEHYRIGNRDCYNLL